MIYRHIATDANGNAFNSISIKKLKGANVAMFDAVCSSLDFGYFISSKKRPVSALDLGRAASNLIIHSVPNLALTLNNSS